MPKALLPIVVCAAAGALVLLLLYKLHQLPQGAPEKKPSKPVSAAPATTTKGPGADAWLRRPHTNTPLSKSEALSELERALQRPDLKGALWFRNKVAEQMDAILKDKELTRNLLEDIRKYGIDSTNPKSRDVMLPLLRVVRGPEATAMIEEAYYQTTSEAERMTLLEALAHPYHDPKKAGILAVERALNAKTAEDRNRAFDVIQHYDSDSNPQVVFDTGKAIFESSTSKTQRAQVLEAITTIANRSTQARSWLRQELRAPRFEDLTSLIRGIEGWGNEDDAANLETLAVEYPALGEMLRERAKIIRQRIRTQAREKEQRAQATH